jgi:hypothetical protein
LIFIIFLYELFVEDICECARLNEIINGIGGKSVIVIRYNPDIIKNKNNIITISQEKRLTLLVKTIKKYLMKDYDTFIVKCSYAEYSFIIMIIMIIIKKLQKKI